MKKLVTISLFSVLVLSGLSVHCAPDGKEMFERAVHERSMPILLSAADLGYAPAQREFARVCFKSPGDERTGLTYCILASDQEDTKALYDLAIINFDGLYGVMRNQLYALRLYKKAANGGLVDAMYDLACCYRNGFGDSPEEARFYFQQAADRGMEDAIVELSRLDRKEEALQAR